MSILVIFASSFGLARAYTTFQPNCSYPSKAVNFVSSSETRGTLDILWSCLFTIIACTWTVQHLNVPEQREDKDKGWRGDIKWAMKRGWIRTEWMLMTVIAPELLVSKAFGDLMALKLDHKRLSQLATVDGVPWSRTHTRLANMGGFVVRVDDSKKGHPVHEETSFTQGNTPDSSKNPGEDAPIQHLDKAVQTLPISVSTDSVPLQHSTSYIGIQPASLPKTPPTFNNPETRLSTPSTKTPNPFHLLAPDLISLRETSKHISKLPSITTAEIYDKDKSDGLIRALAVVQIIWTIVQILVRASRTLAVTQIEVAVVAFAICAILIYSLNWEKPQGVQTPYTVIRYDQAIPVEVLKVARKTLRKRTSTGLMGIAVNYACFTN